MRKTIVLLFNNWKVFYQGVDGYICVGLFQLPVATEPKKRRAPKGNASIFLYLVIIKCSRHSFKLNPIGF